MKAIETTPEGGEKFSIPGGPEERNHFAIGIIEAARNLKEETPVGKIKPIFDLLSHLMPDDHDLRAGG
jgi:hypothetical protein